MCRWPSHGPSGRALEGGDDGAFVAAGGFADDLGAGDGLQARDQLGVARRGVGQRVLAALEVELQRGLGDVQAGIDGLRFFRQDLHGVGTLTCTSEHVHAGTAPSTVRVTDTSADGSSSPANPRERFQGQTNAVALPFSPGRGRTASASCLASAKQERRKETYKGPRQTLSELQDAVRLLKSVALGHKFVRSRGVEFEEVVVAGHN